MEVGHWDVAAAFSTCCREGGVQFSWEHHNLAFILSTIKRKRKCSNNIFFGSETSRAQRKAYDIGHSGYVCNPDVGPVAQEAGSLSRATVSQPHTSSVPGAPCYPGFLTPWCLAGLGLRAEFKQVALQGLGPLAVSFSESCYLGH